MDNQSPQQPPMQWQVSADQKQQQAPEQERAKDENKSSRACCIIPLVVLLVLVGLVAGGWWYVNQMLTKPQGVDTTVRQFTITQGESSGEISTKLEQEKLVKNAFVFRLYVWKKGLGGLFQPGTYELKQSMTMDEIMSLLAHKKEALQEASLTFLEGWTLAQDAELIGDKTNLSPSEFLDLAKNPHDHFDDYDFVKELPKDATLEGFLFPDTYRINEKTTNEDVIRKMLSNFGNQVTHELRDKAKEQAGSLFKAITLASIVEREVQTKGDKAIVAGIFYNRLAVGKRLESDATVNYALGTKDLQPTLDQTQTNSPYNTYVVSGLPKGPISNPGIDSINAVIAPQKTDYYYFLTTLDTGEVKYGKTYEEHLANKQKYLK